GDVQKIVWENPAARKRTKNPRKRGYVPGVGSGENRSGLLGSTVFVFLALQVPATDAAPGQAGHELFRRVLGDRPVVVEPVPGAGLGLPGQADAQQVGLLVG